MIKKVEVYRKIRSEKPNKEYRLDYLLVVRFEKVLFQPPKTILNPQPAVKGRGTECRWHAWSCMCP